MNNNKRYDLSDYLIHFFRDIDLESNSSIVFPEHMGWQNLFEDTTFPAIFMLRAALRNGRLWATWSERNNVRTIYGPNPAICFTEMPIAAFLEAGHVRWGSGQAMSPFALVFPKNLLFQLGARPVIYGFSADVNASAYFDSVGNRKFPESAIPTKEQYRYVTFNIGSSKSIDWTHEREWRWPYRGDVSHINAQLNDCGILSSWDEIPGLDFYNMNIQGIGVIVENKQQADLIVSDMLTLVDGGQASVETFSFVLASDLLPTVELLRDPKDILSAVSSAMVDLNPYFEIKKQDCENYNKRFIELIEHVENTSGEPRQDEFGGCWLWMHDNAAPLTRALLQTGRVFVSKEGRYLACLHEFSDSRSLQEREEMTSRLANMVREEFKTPCGYFSVRDSNNPSAVPFYANDFEDDIAFFNCTWNYSR